VRGNHLVVILYNILSLIVFVLGFPLIASNVLSRQKRWKTVKKRLGTEGLRKIPGRRPIWIHAVSVGETIASVPLIRAIRDRHPELPVVVSVSTLTGHDVAGRLLGPIVDAVFFFPFDFFWSVRKAIRCVCPTLFVLVESDIWPNLIFELKRHEIPFILVSARMSEKSFRGYGRISPFMREVFLHMSSICSQTERDAKRFVDIGAPPDKLFVTGNIKFDQPMDGPSEEQIAQLRTSMRIRQDASVFLAGSTHHGEEELLLRTFRELKKRLPDLVMVLAPRDPARAKGVKQLFQQAELATFLRTDLLNADDSSLPDVVIVDTLGELRRLYAVADVVFVGKSLVNLGGQNPLEPAALGKAILFGPHMFNFELIARTLIQGGGAVEVASEKELLARANELLEDRARSDTLGERAHEVYVRNRGAVERTLQVLERFLSA
jgi:3-deoxy-D-manno-octulosonic-acid transferase